MESPSTKTTIILGSVILVAAIAGLALHQGGRATGDSTRSPYTGQEERGIAALSPDAVESLRKGSGTPFGGMAKPAELNGHPGPRHVLDMADAGKLDLTDEQYDRISALHEEMRTDAIRLGKRIIALEKEIDEAFANDTMTEERLKDKVMKSAELYGELRTVHLKHHLTTTDVLTQDQTEQYNELRGYTTDKDPCEEVPDGHDPEMWKKHHGC